MAHCINYGAVAKVMGRLIGVEAILLLIPMTICLANSEPDWSGFLIAAAAAAATSLLSELFTRNITLAIHLREGFILTALVWIVFAMFGIIPLMLGSSPLSFTDAFFEAISGFTTTGASVYPDVGLLGKGILLWRAEMQWIGGLGIIFFMLAMLPALNRADGISLFNAEATGIYHSKLHPRIRQTALSLWGVYAALTLACILLLWAGPMSLFDAVCQTFAAISTGGFTTHAQGLAFWNSDYVDSILTLFMAVGGINFMLLYGAARGRWKDIFGNAVVRCYICVIIVAWLFQAAAVWWNGSSSFSDIVIHPLTHTVAAVTSTGFTVEGAENWGQLSLFITMLLMMAGSCAGSTAGGIKIDRLIAVASNLKANVMKAIYPRRQYVVRIGHDALDDDVTNRIAAFISIYLLLIGATTLLSLLLGYNLVDSLFLSLSAIGDNGLGYGITGAQGGFAVLHPILKWAMTFDMLAGRLELFTVIVLLAPAFWRR